MLHILSLIVVFLYAISLIVIFLYSLAQVHLVYHYLKNEDKTDEKEGDETLKFHAKVTVQLPIYNERYVIKRLLNAVSKFNWPKQKLEIQVLDDSTDDTSAIIATKVEELQNKEFNIKHIQRNSREGYKAGALQYGLKRAKGKFIVIFDADFVPGKNFLKKTVPHFKNKKIGMVQTCWTHLNKKYSLLTCMQAFALDAHFSIEQKGRNSAGYFMNFNGTAGVWRKSCIEESGGWQHDTLTEDLDLSYRAQLKGWKFKYLEEVKTPAELPVAISAIKSQQHRWMKGAAESARKHLSRLWKSDASFLKKIQGSSHLMGSGIFIFILLLSVLSVPLLWVKNIDPSLAQFFIIASFFSIGLFGWILFYGTSFKDEGSSKFTKTIRFITLFPLFLSLSMAFSLNNTMAVLKGYARKASPFIRTPKFNITNSSGNWSNNKYLFSKLNVSSFVEGLLALYFLGGIFLAFIVNDFGLLPFHLMLFFGFGAVFGYSVYEHRMQTA